MPDRSQDVTRLLGRWGGGDPEALDRLMPLVYQELHRLARGYLAREPAAQTLQPTALVSEAYLRLVDQSRVEWRSRAHFLGIAAQMMRRILVDHARARGSAKRGGRVRKVSLEEAASVGGGGREVDLMALDDALVALAELDPRQSRIVELRFFGGLSVEETAEVLGISPATVKRDWSVAKAWLYREVSS